MIQKLSSRKLWLALAGVVMGIALALGVDANEIRVISGAVVTLVSAVTYIVTEGKIDAESVKNAILDIEDVTDLFDEEADGNS